MITTETGLTRCSLVHRVVTLEGWQTTPSAPRVSVDVPPSLRVPAKKSAKDEKTHVEITGGVDHWYRGCCACVDKVAGWYAEDLSWFGYPRPECDVNGTGTDNCNMR